MERNIRLKRFLIRIFIGLLFLKILLNLLRNAIHVKVRETFHNETRCPKIAFKFVRYLIFGGSTSWDLFQCQGVINTYCLLMTLEWWYVFLRCNFQGLEFLRL